MADRDKAGRFQPGHSQPGPGRSSKYDPAFCDIVEETMRAGYSKMAAAGDIGVDYDTLKNWMGEYLAFFAAVKRGEAARARFLEQGLLEAETGPQVTSRIFALKNAAPDEWKDKQEVDHRSGDGSMSPAKENQDAALEAMRRKHSDA